MSALTPQAVEALERVTDPIPEQWWAVQRATEWIADLLRDPEETELPDAVDELINEVARLGELLGLEVPA